MLVIFDPPLAACENMQKDNALFQRCQTEGLNFLRFYSWQDHSVSLGYRQTDINFPKNKVKRITGGGAVLHCPGELTYSLGIHGSFRRQLSVQNACSRISALIVDVLQAKDLKVSSVENSRDNRISDDICFSQTAPYEIRLGNKKLVGSAQKMSKTALFQHGSIGIEAPDSELLSGTQFEDLLHRQAFLKDHLDLNYLDLAIDLTKSFKKSLLKQLA